MLRFLSSCYVLVAVAAALTVLLAKPVAASYSGLVNIPTADVVEPGQYIVEPQYSGTWGGPDHTEIIYTQFGLGAGCEAGVDLDLSAGASERWLLNAKVLLQPETDHVPALAAGLCNVGPDSAAIAYLVGMRSLGSTRAHVGVQHASGRWDGFLGLDLELTDRLWLYGDVTTGSDNSSSVGVTYQLDERCGLNAGVIWPHAEDDDPQFLLSVTLGGSLK